VKIPTGGEVLFAPARDPSRSLASSYPSTTIPMSAFRYICIGTVDSV